MGANVLSWDRRFVLVMGALVLLLGCVVIPRRYLESEPAYIPFVLIGLGLIVGLAFKLPGAFIPPLLFAGKLKAHAAEGFSPSDPTVWALLLLVVTICIQGAVLASRDSARSIWGLLQESRRGLVAFGVCVIIITISYLYTSAPIYGGEEARKFALIGSLLFVAPILLIRDQRQFKAFVGTCVVLSIVLLIKRATVLTSLSSDQDATNIGSGELFGMTALLLFTFRLSNARLWRFVAFVMVAAFCLATLASVSRGAVLFLLAAGFLSLLFGPSQMGLGSKKLTIVLFAAILGLLAVMFSWVELFAPQKFESKTAELSELGSGGDPEGTAGTRLKYWKETALGFAEHPIFGHGIGSASVYLTGIDQREYPHNLVIQIAFEQGIIGLAAYLFLLSSAFAQARKAWIATGGALACLIWMLLFHVGISLTSGDLDDQRALWTWCGMACAGWAWSQSHVSSSGGGADAKPAATALHRRFVRPLKLREDR